MHWQTHTVFNQPIPLNNSNLYLSDGALCEAVTREGAGWDSDFLASIGQQLGTAESLELGRLANVNPPELLRYDAQGRRLDDVRFHPAWHLLMQALCTNRVHNLAWEEDARSGAFVARAARFMLRFVDWHGNDGKAGRFRCHEQHHPRRAPGRWLLSAGGA